MSHSDSPVLNVEELLELPPLSPSSGVRRLMWLYISISLGAVLWAIYNNQLQRFWNSYFVDVVFFMGLTVGSVAAAAIFQIVRATWAGPVRRIAEAGSNFLPWIFILWLTTYFGKEYIYPWATKPFPGREFWMQPNFVYARFAVLLGVLFYLMWRFVRLSLRSDIGFLREKAINKKPWSYSEYEGISSNWRGSEIEVPEIQRKLSWNAPVVIILYIFIYSLFCFEMIMSIDAVWYANMFGGFNFVGNIYLAWATIGITLVILKESHENFNKILTTKHFWDLGMLAFGFCMLWGYMFFAHFLPQWYGNLPEETQWMILRTREFPWKGWAWFVFPMCFVIPFIVLLSRDLKKTPKLFATVCLLIFCGIWAEKYLVITPQWSPAEIPFGFFDIALFLGFLGAYVLAVQDFLSRYPFVPLSHPQTKGKVDW